MSDESAKQSAPRPTGHKVDRVGCCGHLDGVFIDISGVDLVKFALNSLGPCSEQLKNKCGEPPERLKNLFHLLLRNVDRRRIFRVRYSFRTATDVLKLWYRASLALG
jgi:hypothetical protein